MELVDQVGAVSQVLWRFPGSLFYWVADPLDQVLEALVVEARVEDGVDLKLLVLIDDHWRRGRLVTVGEGRHCVGFQEGDVKHGMDFAEGGKR